MWMQKMTVVRPAAGTWTGMVAAVWAVRTQPVLQPLQRIVRRVLRGTAGVMEKRVCQWAERQWRQGLQGQWKVRSERASVRGMRRGEGWAARAVEAGEGGVAVGGEARVACMMVVMTEVMGWDGDE